MTLFDILLQKLFQTLSIKEKKNYTKNHTHVKKVGHTSEFLFGIF